MLFTKSVEKGRNGTSGTAIEEVGKAVAEREETIWQGHIVRSGSNPL
jgi:hypothetical protein